MINNPFGARMQKLTFGVLKGIPALRMNVRSLEKSL
jgi:hypothetical protein